MTLIPRVPALIAVAAMWSTPLCAETDVVWTERVDALFTEWDTPRSPGCSIAIADDGKIVHARGYGMANLEYGAVNRPDTIFHIASISKQFTAASIVLLELDGAISLDDPVKKYIPELPEFGPTITIRHLVHHTSGLRDQWSLLAMAGWRYARDRISDEDVLRVLERQRDLNFEPGSQYSYSNMGYTLLAQIVARVSGRSLREFTRERIFAPLGMEHTFFRDDFSEVIHGFAYGYGKEDAEFKTSVTNFNTVGATSLLTTVEDLMRWEENFYTAEVGGNAMIARMLERGPLNDGSQIDYAFGIIHDTYRGLRTINHEGADAGYVSQLIRFPDRHVSIACLCNVNEARPAELANAIADIYLGDDLDEEEDAEPITLSRGEREAKAGTYVNRESARSYRIVSRDGKLLAAGHDWEDELQHLGSNRFTLGDGWAEIAFADGRPGSLVMRRGDYKPLVYERVAAFDPTPSELRDYAGTYASDEFDMRYRLTIEKNELRLRTLKLEPLALGPITRDVFKGGWYNMRFVRDGSGEVSGARINSGGDAIYRFVRLEKGQR